MRFVQSLLNSPAERPGPKYYTALPDWRLHGRTFQAAMYLARNTVTGTSRADNAALVGRARVARDTELLNVAVMLERLAELPYRWYMSRLGYAARRGHITGYFREIARQLNTDEEDLRRRCKVYRPQA
jgi:hypothetical protein